MTKQKKRIPDTSEKELENLLEVYMSRLEQKVAFETQSMQLMADAMPQIVWTARPDGTVDYFNKRWYDYTGHEAKKLPQPHDWSAIVHPDDLERAVETWEHSTKTGTPFEIEYRFIDRNTGNYRWFLGRALPGHDPKGRIVRWFGTFTDINEHKQAQEKKDEFIAIASHELKTPVTSIKTFAQLTQRQLTKAGEHQLVGYLEKMDAQINKLSSLINDLLDVSKIERGKLELARETFALDEFIADVIDTQQLTSDRHQIILDNNSGARVNADRNRLEQVLVNLTSNAIKYSPHADKVLVKTAVKNKEVVVSVQDYGIGIAKGQLGQLFERFFRASGSQHDTFPGLGLGLYIVAEIIRREGGRVWAESEEGKGSTFYFALPILKPKKSNKPTSKGGS